MQDTAELPKVAAVTLMLMTATPPTPRLPKAQFRVPEVFEQEPWEADAET